MIELHEVYEEPEGCKHVFEKYLGTQFYEHFEVTHECVYCGAIKVRIKV